MMKFAVAFLSLLLAAGCGGGSGGNSNSGGGGSPTNPTPTPNPTPNPTPGGATITITSTGVSPRELTVSPGSRVTFVNNNTRPHDMSSDPHPDHTDCPEINQVGFLQPGQSRQTGNLNEVRTCGFHDHNQPGVDSLTGRIIVM